MNTVCNTGTVIVTQMKTFSGYKHVSLRFQAITNILSPYNEQ